MVWLSRHDLHNTAASLSFSVATPDVLYTRVLTDYERYVYAYSSSSFMSMFEAVLSLVHFVLLCIVRIRRKLALFCVLCDNPGVCIQKSIIYKKLPLFLWRLGPHYKSPTDAILTRPPPWWCAECDSGGAGTGSGYSPSSARQEGVSKLDSSTVCVCVCVCVSCVDAWRTEENVVIGSSLYSNI